MRQFIILLTFLIVTTNLFSQIRFDQKISITDSLTVELFWNSFRSSIQNKDKEKLAGLFKFPFYCHQCLDYAQANAPYNATVKVSKKLFLDSVYLLFFNIPTLNELTKKIWSDTMIFHKMNDPGIKSGWTFSYAINYSKEYEYAMGFIYLRKIKGKYLIVGLDTVP